MSISAQRASIMVRLRSMRSSSAQEINILETPLGIEKKEKVLKVFSVFDHGNRKRVNISDIPQILRGLGLYVTEAEAKDIANQVQDKNFKGTVQLDDFTHYIVNIMLQGKYGPESTETLLDAFEIFDPEKKGYLERELFEHIMTLGPNDIEKFSQIEKGLKEKNEKLTIKVSLSDEDINDTITKEEEEENKTDIRYSEDYKPKDKVKGDAYKIEPLSKEEMNEMMKVALDPKTDTINYGELILKFVACQDFKESPI